jgi:endonuclease III-like uncharacterized protein
MKKATSQVQKVRFTKALIKSLEGKFFSVSNIKKDGSKRAYNSVRIDVKKYLQQGSVNKETFDSLVVYCQDSDRKYTVKRTLKLDTIEFIQIRGEKVYFK